MPGFQGKETQFNSFLLFLFLFLFFFFFFWKTHWPSKHGGLKSIQGVNNNRLGFANVGGGGGGGGGGFGGES